MFLGQVSMIGPDSDSAAGKITIRQVGLFNALDHGRLDGASYLGLGWWQPWTRLERDRHRPMGWDGCLGPCRLVVVVVGNKIIITWRHVDAAVVLPRELSPVSRQIDRLLAIKGPSAVVPRPEISLLWPCARVDFDRVVIVVAGEDSRIARVGKQIVELGLRLWLW